LKNVTSCKYSPPNQFIWYRLQQLDIDDPLLQLADVIPWSEFEQAFAKYYTSDVGRPAKPIRLMVGLQLLKYLKNLGERGPRKNQKVTRKPEI